MITAKRAKSQARTGDIRLEITSVSGQCFAAGFLIGGTRLVVAGQSAVLCVVIATTTARQPVTAIFGKIATG